MSHAINRIPCPIHTYNTHTHTTHTDGDTWHLHFLLRFLKRHLRQATRLGNCSTVAPLMTVTQIGCHSRKSQNEKRERDSCMYVCVCVCHKCILYVHTRIIIINTQCYWGSQHVSMLENCSNKSTRITLHIVFSSFLFLYFY